MRRKPMGYSPKNEEPKSLEEMAGVEFARLSSGRRVKIKTHTLGTLWKFQERLSRAVCDPREATAVRFFQYSLESVDGGAGTSLRRALGLADFSARVLRREISAADARRLRDEIVKANLGMEYEEYYTRCLEAVKKKILMKTKSGATGERSPRCCSATGDCDPRSFLK